MSTNVVELKRPEKSDTSLEYVRDLTCGLSVYAGFCQREMTWRWLVYDADREVDERGCAETFEMAKKEARRIAGSLLRQSLEELKR